MSCYKLPMLLQPSNVFKVMLLFQFLIIFYYSDPYPGFFAPNFEISIRFPTKFQNYQNSHCCDCLGFFSLTTVIENF